MISCAETYQFFCHARGVVAESTLNPFRYTHSLYPLQLSVRMYVPALSFAGKPSEDNRPSNARTWRKKILCARQAAAEHTTRVRPSGEQQLEIITGRLLLVWCGETGSLAVHRTGHIFSGWCRRRWHRRRLLVSYKLVSFI